MRRRLPLAALAAASALFLAAPSSSALVTKPSDKEKLSVLQKQLAQLDKELGGELEDLKDLEFDAKRTLQRKDDLAEELEKSRTAVARIASNKYMNQGLDPSIGALQQGDPNTMLAGAAMLQHLTDNETQRLGQVQYLLDLQAKANRDAKAKLKKLQLAIAEMRSRKEEIRKKIAKFAPTPFVGNSGLTTRLVDMRQAALDSQGPFLMVGCLRPGDPQDHGTGRACDFMESTGGSMPTAERKAQGDRLLAWAIKNHVKYGIKYVIWQQRYYDMRSGSSKTMSNRGSITQNHYDHVHISVF
ncbi:hypothetical protein GCM10027589_40010 [Actinocorallia lasiicapitis]